LFLKGLFHFILVFKKKQLKIAFFCYF
jgi:hypothetical protein